MGFKDAIRKRVNEFLNAERDIPLSKEQLRDSGKKVAGAFESGITPSELDVWNWYESRVSVERDLKSRYLDYESMDDYPDFCLSGDTLVYTLWGPIPFRKLAEEYADKEIPILAYDRGNRRFVPSIGIKPRLTAKGAKVVRVVFDDGTVLVGTPDHPIMMMDGSYFPLGDLRTGMSVQPMFTRMGRMGYLEVMQPLQDQSGRAKYQWELVHRMVAAAIYGADKIEGMIVHHKDRDRSNADPANLEVMTGHEHARIHFEAGDSVVDWTPARRAAVGERMLGNKHRAGTTSSDETRLKQSVSMKAYKSQHPNQNEEWVRKRAEATRIVLSEDIVREAAKGAGSVLDVATRLEVSWRVASRHLERFGIDFKKERDLFYEVRDKGEEAKKESARKASKRSRWGHAANHKVMKVEDWGTEDVYDLSVPGLENFVANGVVVHNSAALDTWADESTQPDQMKKVSVWVESPTHTIAERGNEILDLIGIENDMWGLSRGLAKYGDQYGELLLNENGVVGIQYLDTPTVRVVAKSGKEIGYVQDPEGKFDITPTLFEKVLAEGNGIAGEMALFHPWEVVHWKLMLRRLRGLYGHGIGESVRWLHKRVIMLEDSAVLFKITRAPVRTAYYVACGEIPPEKRLAYVKQVKSQFRKKQFKSPDGKINFAYNPMNPHEEYWLPSGGGAGDTRIESIGGSDFQSMELLDYMQAKYHMALKVPRTHMGFAGEPAQAMLAQIDVKFARAVLRLQAAICRGVDRTLEVDLMARNIDPSTVKYAARMTMPSSIFELARMEVWNARADLMSRIGEQMPLVWMLMNIVGLSEDEAAQVIALKQYEKRMLALWDARNMADAEKIQTGAGGDSSGGGYESVQPFLPQKVLHEERALEARFRRSDEKRVLEKVNSLLVRDVGMAHRLQELRSMIREIHRQTVLK